MHTVCEAHGSGQQPYVLCARQCCGTQTLRTSLLCFLSRVRAAIALFLRQGRRLCRFFSLELVHLLACCNPQSARARAGAGTASAAVVNACRVREQGGAGVRYEGPVRIAHRDLRRHDCLPLTVGLSC